MIYNPFLDPSIDSHLCGLAIPMLGSWTCHWSSRPSKVLVSCGGQPSQNSMSFISICIPFRCVHPWGHICNIYIYICLKMREETLGTSTIPSAVLLYVRCNPDVAPRLTSGGYEDTVDVITPINILFIGGGKIWSLMKIGGGELWSLMEI